PYGVSASSTSSNGERATPPASQARSPDGSAASAASADSRVANSTKQPLPEPVKRGEPMRDNASNTASMAGSRRRTTGSNALPSPIPETKSAIVAGAAFLVNSGAWNSAAVPTCTPGSASTYQAGGNATGLSSSPTPSAQAVRPRTNTGTSAPSPRPSPARRSSPSCRPQR